MIFSFKFFCADQGLHERPLESQAAAHQQGPPTSSMSNRLHDRPLESQVAHQ